MAAATGLLAEDSLLCSICLCVFTKPVSIHCGHNFCLDCITKYWDTVTSILQCPVCREKFSTRPQLRVNIVIAEMSEKVKKEASSSCTEQAGTGDVLCGLCTGTNVKALKSCLVCFMSYCQKHLEPHQRISALVKHKLINPAKNLESRVCNNHDQPLDLFCRADQIFLCESCKDRDHKTHKIVTLEKEAELRKTQLGLEEKDLDQMIQTREQKIQEVQQSLKTSRNEAEEAKTCSRKVMTAVMEHIKTEFTGLTEAIDTKQEKNETEGEGFMNNLQGEIRQIKQKKLELHQVSLTSDPFSFLESLLSLISDKPRLKDWSDVTLSRDQFMIQEAMTKLETTVKEEVSKMCDLNFKAATLDENQQRLIEMETFYKEKLDEERSALKHKDEELKSVNQRFTEMETFYKEQLKAERSALKHKAEELKSVKLRLTEMDTFYKDKRDGDIRPNKEADERSSCQQCEHYKLRLSESEKLFEEKLHKERAALQQKEEELKSFKDRMAADVSVSIKAGSTESLNSPLSKSRLTEMYQKLRVLQWPKIKDQLKSSSMTPEATKDLIQKIFKHASEQMTRKKKQLEEVLGLTDPCSAPAPKKVTEYKQLAFQNLKMSLYHSSKEDLLKTLLHKHEQKYSKDVMENLIPLASECYWLGCLMGLNNPPLRVDWKNHVRGRDPWDIFPRDVIVSSHVEEANSAKKDKHSCLTS